MKPSCKAQSAVGRRCYAWLALFLSFAAMTAHGQLVALDSAIQGKYLGEYLGVWVDPTGSADLELVTRQTSWASVPEAIPNFGHSSDVYWFRLEIQSAVVDDSWVMVVSNVLLDYVDLYSVAEDGRLLDHFAGGGQRALTDREILHRYLVMPLRTQGESNLTLYIRVASFHAVQLPVTLWPLEAYAAYDEREVILTGILLGSLFIMLLYNLFLYTTLRDPIYLAYVGSVFGFMLLQVSIKGFGYRFLWPDQILISAISVFVSAFATIFFATTFASWFMNLRERKFRYMILVDFARWGALASALFVTLLPDGWRLYLMVGFGVLAITLGFVAIFTYYRSDDRPIQIFAAGWVVLLIGALLFLINKLGLVSVNIWTEQTMSVGTVIEMILFSMALGDRINNEKEQALKAKSLLLRSLDAERVEKQNILISEETAREAKELTLKIQQETNDNLEAEIEQRTAELRQANDQLAELVKLDPLTGVYNRHHFNECISNAFATANRSGSDLSLLMIDVDHFKSINDQYGHLVGDRCLVKVASVMQDLTLSSDGVLFRFGGEEFSVILPGTSEGAALELAEKIRETLESSVIIKKVGPDHVTVSVGVATMCPRRSQRPEDLVGLADQALYRAKEEGRNRVIVQNNNEGLGYA